MPAGPCAQLFLPSDAQAETGYLVGWNAHSFMCTVCGVIDSKTTTLEELEGALASLASSPALAELAAHCGGPPSLLGVLLPRGSEVDVTIRPRAEAAELWLTLDAGSTGPSLRAVHCCGCKHRSPLQLILYRRGRHDDEWHPRPSLHSLWDTAASSPDAGPTPPSALAMSLRHACCSGEWQRALRSTLGHSPSRHVAWRRLLLRIMLILCAPIALALRALASACLSLLRLEVIPSLAPRRWSYAARQTEARLVRAIEWPHRWRAAQATPLWHAGARLERIHTYGELTCALIDAALGCCLAAVLVRWRVELCVLAGALPANVHDEWLPGLVRWLMGVDPGGFKLNENLNFALGSCVLMLLRAWHDSLALLLSLLPPPSVSLIALLPGTCLGASVGVAIASDVLAVSVLHLRLLYRTMGSVYAAYLTALYSLFNVFRGTKVCAHLPASPRDSVHLHPSVAVR